MQPYLIPYAGYFRLLSDTDMFVIYDDVQFPKEGWVHRNRLLNRNNELAWCTLPLKKKSLATKISEIEFSADADIRWESQLRKFPIMDEKYLPDDLLKKMVCNLDSSPVDFIVKILQLTCEILNIPFNVEYSSNINVGSDMKGQDRVLEIVKHFGAEEYVNAPGGKHLYDEKDFLNQGIRLSFIPDYQGSNTSILQRLLTEKTSDIREEIYDF